MSWTHPPPSWDRLRQPLDLVLASAEQLVAVEVALFCISPVDGTAAATPSTAPRLGITGGCFGL